MKVPSRVDNNLNFSLIYFHVLRCRLLIYSHSFISPLRGESLLSSLLLPSLYPPEAHYIGARASAVSRAPKIITRPATALVSSLVNHRRRATGEAIVDGVSDEDVGSLFIHHIFQEINLHRISVTVPRQRRWYERGGKQLLRGRQRRAVDSFRYNLINVTHLVFFPPSPPSNLNPLSSTVQLRSYLLITSYI